MVCLLEAEKDSMKYTRVLKDKEMWKQREKYRLKEGEKEWGVQWRDKQSIICGVEKRSQRSAALTSY